ncbi:hypothetical protein NDU88_003458 [Pleurodeles waltl]|uniref:Uncharacterized protein n=1 Tax=Pleurodeles waltl TaxID=8319 RepID=A0AAV7M8V6_PLEWA|nr:hypothetical protein NDU88_003458 [Pleurodeles waltl]
MFVPLAATYVQTLRILTISKSLLPGHTQYSRLGLDGGAVFARSPLLEEGGHPVCTGAGVGSSARLCVVEAGEGEYWASGARGRVTEIIPSAGEPWRSSCRQPPAPVCSSSLLQVPNLHSTLCSAVPARGLLPMGWAGFSHSREVGLGCPTYRRAPESRRSRLR